MRKKNIKETQNEKHKKRNAATTTTAATRAAAAPPPSTATETAAAAATAAVTATTINWQSVPLKKQLHRHTHTHIRAQTSKHIHVRRYLPEREREREPERATALSTQFQCCRAAHPAMLTCCRQALLLLFSLACFAALSSQTALFLSLTLRSLALIVALPLPPPLSPGKADA